MAAEKPTYAVGAAIPEDMLAEPPEFEGKFDPHVWFDPALWKHALQEIAGRARRASTPIMQTPTKRI
ncbi:MAG: hypothetical protein R2849_07595 [Thermomicrobiales bacterium]